MSDVPSNLIPTRITQLPYAPAPPSLDGILLYVYQGNSYQVRAADLVSVTGVPPTRQVIAGTGLSGGGALSSDITLSVTPNGIGTAQLAASGVTSGVYGDSTHIPVIRIDATGRVTSASVTAMPAGSGTVTTVSVVSANGFTGTVATNATTPAITLATSITGILKGNGTSLAAAIAADFPTLNQNTTGTAANVTGVVAVANGGTGTTTPAIVAGANITVSGTWPNQTIASSGGGGGSGTVTSVSVVSANGFTGTVANPTTTPAVTLATSITGILKGNGTSLAAATTTDFPANYGTVTGVDTLVISELSVGCCPPTYYTLYSYNGATPVLTSPVLTASSNYYQNISGASTNDNNIAKITLPNATTLAKGRTFVFINTSLTFSGSFTLTYANGTTLAVMPLNTTCNVTLTDNSTTNGVWAVIKAPIESPIRYSTKYYVPVGSGGVGPMPTTPAVGSLITYGSDSFGAIGNPTTGKMLAYSAGAWGPVTYVDVSSTQTWTGTQTFAPNTTAFTATQANLSTNASIVTTQAGATVVLAIGSNKTFYYSNVSGPTANMSLNVRMSGTGTTSTGSLNTALATSQSTKITFILKQPAVPVNYISQILIDGVATNVTVVGLPGSIAGAIANGITVTVINILKTAASTYLVYINATNY